MQETRKIKTGIEYRHAAFDRAAVNEEARTAELAFSSETPYERWFGTEILDHNTGSVRLSRLNDGGPLLLDHDTCCHIGVVESADIGPDRVGRAVVRFGRSDQAESAFRDVMDGIRKHVSVGYLVHRMKEEGDHEEGAQPTYRVTDWEPLEVSLVAVPADPTVGVGRAAAFTEHETEVERRQQAAPAKPNQENPMSETIDVQVIENNARAAAEKAERQRTNDIAALGDAHAKRGGDKLAMQYIREGKGVEEFRAALLDLVAKSAAETVLVDLSEKDVARYSYGRAIAMALARAEGGRVDGIEAELSAELERQMPAGYKKNGGIFVPLSLAQRNAISTALYNTSTKGSETVFTKPGDFIELLRNAMCCARLGARMLTGLDGPLSFPKQNGAATANWVAENSGTDVSASNATIGSVPLAPKTLQATTAYSRQLLAQSSIDVEAFIRDDLASVHGLAIDLAAMHGSGSANQPTGIYSASSVNAVAMGGVPTFGKLVDMVTEVAKDNALLGSTGWCTTPGMAGKLMQTLVASAAGSDMIWTGRLDDGLLAGYRAHSSNQVSAALGGGSEHGIIFGNWADLMIGMWGALEVIVDPYSLKKQGMVEVTTFQMADIALRHPESFCKATGATLS